VMIASRSLNPPKKGPICDRLRPYENLTSPRRREPCSSCAHGPSLGTAWFNERVRKFVAQSCNRQRRIRAHRPRHDRSVGNEQARIIEDLPRGVNDALIHISAMGQPPSPCTVITLRKYHKRIDLELRVKLVGQASHRCLHSVEVRPGSRQIPVQLHHLIPE